MLGDEFLEMRLYSQKKMMTKSLRMKRRKLRKGSLLENGYDMEKVICK